ncbi:MAG: dihydroneopterin aldolase [Schleiferiaceae bacterium]|jgi:dihydroneopterin aldolase
MDKIYVQGIKLYAYHGCMEEESKIGSDYEVNVVVWGNFDQAIESDKLSDTIDYVHINQIVKEEMALRNKLLEVVVDRICYRLFKESALVKKASVSVSKLAPPINGDVERVTVERKVKRSYYSSLENQ